MNKRDLRRTPFSRNGAAELASAPETTENAIAKRREIVDAAAELFDQYGFHQVTMGVIAEAVGMRKGTLYHYIKKKEDILFLIHEMCTDHLLERHRLRADTRMTAEQALFELMADNIEFTESHRAHVRVFFEYYREVSDEQYQSILDRRHLYVQIVEEVIARGVRDGEFRADVNPELVMFAIFGMSNWTYQWFRPDGPLSGRQVAEAFWTIAMDGLRAGQPERP